MNHPVVFGNQVEPRASLPHSNEFGECSLRVRDRLQDVATDDEIVTSSRQRKVEDLEQQMMGLCAPQWDLQAPPLPEGPANDYRLLVHEIMHVMLDNELFTFVTAPRVFDACPR